MVIKLFLYMDVIVKRIKDIREAKGLKQKEIADKIGIEQANYSRFEKRGKKLTVEQVEQIADALGVTAKEILYGDSAGSIDELQQQKLRLEVTQRDREIDLLNKELSDKSEMINRLLKIVEGKTSDYVKLLEKQIEEYKIDLFTIKKTLEANNIDVKKLFKGGTERATFNDI